MLDGAQRILSHHVACAAWICTGTRIFTGAPAASFQPVMGMDEFGMIYGCLNDIHPPTCWSR